MKMERKQVGWSFCIWWTALTVAGGLVGNSLADRLGLGILSRPTDAGILFSMLGSGLFGLTVGAAQSVLLRRRFSKSTWWWVAGAFGRALGVLVGSIAVVIISHQFGLQAGFWTTSLYLTLRAAVLGGSQWLILRQWRTKTGWWVLVNAIAWTLGPALMELFIPSTSVTAPLLGDLLTLASAGAVTGAVMVWLLRQPTRAPIIQTQGDRIIVASIAVWAASWALSWAIGWSVVREIVGSGYILVGGKIGGIVGGAIAGLIGGIGTAMALRLARAPNALRTYHLILIALGWASIVFYDWLDGFVIAGLPASHNSGVVIAALSGSQPTHGIGGPLSGLVGGVLTALVFSWAVRSIHWKQLWLIIIAWASGFAIAGWMVWTIGFPIASNYVRGPTYGNDPGISSLILFTLISALGGAFAGWLGGVATSSHFSTQTIAE